MMRTKNNISELSRKSKMRVAGLMSGTSADGVDAAIIDINKNKVNVLAFDTFAYSPELRRSILQLCGSASCNVADICHFNFVLGEVFAESVIKLCKKSGIGLNTIDLIGSHGQTIYPQSQRQAFRQKDHSFDSANWRAVDNRPATGITTVADFRPRDMAAGGQGAPLVPFADYFLFRDKQSQSCDSEYRRHRQCDLSACGLRSRRYNCFRYRAGQYDNRRHRLNH